MFEVPWCAIMSGGVDITAVHYRAKIVSSNLEIIFIIIMVSVVAGKSVRT